jgi:threonine/homoserine/homoserine lactone efflux protein
VAELAGFLGVATLVIVTPGQDTALTIRNTLLGGRSGGVFTAIGVATGQATWTFVTSLGIGALLAASRPLFIGLKLGGSAYLVFLGGRTILGVLRGHQAEAMVIAPADARLTGLGALRQGLVSNLANPKMLAFFTSLLPQFANSFPGLFIHGLAFSAITLIWLSAYTLTIAKASALLRRPRMGRAVQALTGTVLVGLGLRLAAETARP